MSSIQSPVGPTIPGDSRSADVSNSKVVKTDSILTNTATVTTLNAGAVTVLKGSVTQITSNITPVTLNSASGSVTTVPLTLNGAGATFTVNNSFVTTSSNIQATITNYTGTLGTPLLLRVDNVAAGSFTLTIFEFAGVAMNGTLTIDFMVM